MKQREKELHERMNAAINNAIAEVLNTFDVSGAIRAQLRPELQNLQGDFKEVLFKAYTEEHHV